MIFVFHRVAGITVIYSYVGEFLSSKNREKYLCWAELFWTFGIITLPCEYYNKVRVRFLQKKLCFFFFDYVFHVQTE